MQMLQFVIANHNPDYHPITHSCYLSRKYSASQNVRYVNRIAAPRVIRPNGIESPTIPIHPHLRARFAIAGVYPLHLPTAREKFDRETYQPL